VSNDAKSQRLGVGDESNDAVAQRMENMRAAAGSGRWSEKHSSLTNVLTSLVAHVHEGIISQTTGWP
jgi:hypothetical protein